MSIAKFKKLTQDWIVYYKTHWHFVDHASGSSLVKEDEYHHDSASSWYSHQVQVAEFWMLMYYIVIAHNQTFSEDVNCHAWTTCMKTLLAS